MDLHPGFVEGDNRLEAVQDRQEFKPETRLSLRVADALQFHCWLPECSGADAYVNRERAVREQLNPAVFLMAA
jgi:hypothetical protein